MSRNVIYGESLSIFDDNLLSKLVGRNDDVLVQGLPASI